MPLNPMTVTTAKMALRVKYSADFVLVFAPSHPPPLQRLLHYFQVMKIIERLTKKFGGATADEAAGPAGDATPSSNVPPPSGPADSSNDVSL